MKKKSEEKKKPIFLITLIIIVFLALIGGGIYWYFFWGVDRGYLRSFKEIIESLPKDEEAPLIEAKNITIVEGEKVDLLKDVSVTDNVDKDLEVIVSGDYDSNKPGSYKITYTATDSFNNTATKEITLKVNKKVNTPTNYNKGRYDFVTSKGFSGYTLDGVTYIDGVLIANKTYSLPSTYGNGLKAETQNAFNEMKAAALADGISIWICSGFRSYKTQKNLYNSYVKRDGQAKADTYSARAGYSEHQSGLAMDINKASSSFNGSPAANWLNNNAYKYGFILRYPDGKINETGYKFESWHYRYVGVELATKLYNDGNWITLEDYYGITSQYAN